MSKPTVAIVGRPNVGKSTLFNRIVGGRPAIVSDRPGTTRDRHFGDAEWAGRRFWLVDTGRAGSRLGRARWIAPSAVRWSSRSRNRTSCCSSWTAIRECIRSINAIAERLRRAGRPVLLVVNKLDDLERSTAHLDFYELGLGDPVGVSAAVGKGSGDLLDAVVSRLPPKDPAEDEEAIEVAVVGRPNVGKSSLVNRLLGEERHVVAPEAGTTRDAIDSLLRYRGRSLNFIDTAGLRQPS